MALKQIIVRSLLLRLFGMSALALMFGCAHEPFAGESKPAAVSAPAIAPKPKVIVRYIYADTLPTISGMTTAPFERSPDKPTNIARDVLRIFWPLLTMLGAGLVLIIGLFIEHHVLNRQLAKRRALKAMSV